LIPTLVKTLHWWYSTVRGLKNSWAGMLEQRAGIERARVRHVPEARQVVMDSLRVSGGQRSHDVALALSVRRVEIAQQAEVEYAQPPVRPQDAVSGCGSPATIPSRHTRPKKNRKATSRTARLSNAGS
jgi:hypothetical protein